jgi:hypothetical protein
VSSSDAVYEQLNKIVMTAIFILPLSLIALFESTFNTRRNSWMKNWLRGNDEGEADAPTNRDPEVDGKDAEDGLVISRVKFVELIKVFPNTEQVESSF